MKKGFTLIELLVSSAIFITIGTVVVTVLYISFRVSQRTEVTLLIKSNGSNALTQMVNTIKYSKSLDDPQDCTSVGGVVQDSITVTSTSDDGQTTLSCPTEDFPTIASNSSSLINSNVAQVVEGTCTFTCTQVTIYDPPTIRIQFELVPKSMLGSTNENLTYPFQTSVTMRNYAQ